MAHITTTAPTTIRRFSLPRLRLPKFGIAAALQPLFQLIGDAYSSVYAAPFTCHRPTKTAVADDDLEGRDPSW